MKNFKRIIIALIVACVIIASCPVSGSIVDAATIKVKSGANVTEVKGSGKKIAYKNGSRVKPKKGWYKKGNTQYYFDGKKNYATYVWYKKSDKWYLKKWNKSKKAYEKYTGIKQLSNDKSYYFNKGKKANGIVKKSGKYCYYRNGKQTVYNTSKGAWKKVSKTTKVYFGKGNKSATYAMHKNTLKKWNKTKKSYQKYTGVFTLSNGNTYQFSNGKRAKNPEFSIAAGTAKTTAVCKDAKGNPKNVTGWKQVKDVQYYFNNAATASFKIEKDVCWVFITDAKNQAAGNKETNDHWEKYNGVVDGVYYVKGKVKPAEKDTVTTDQSGLLVKYDGKEWKLLTGTYKKLYYVNGDYASGIVDGKYYKKGKLATGICNDKYYRDGVLGTGSYNGKRYSKGSLLTGDYKNKFYKNGELYTGMRKSNGKYYVNGELATGSYENKYYKDGELYTGVYKSKYYKDGILGTGTCDGKFYKNGELYTGIRKSNGKYYVDGVLANGTYDGVKYVDGVAQSDSEDPSETEEKLTEGEFRTSGGKLQKCQYELANGSVGEFPKLWNFDNGDMIYSDESTFKLSEHPNMKKENGKYYTLAWRDYTGEYESKFYEAGKCVDYKLYGADGKLYTGWCRLTNPNNWEYAKWIHAIDEKQYANLLYVENGVVKQYYVYEGDETHVWCNECGSDMTLQGVGEADHADICHKGTIMPELYWSGATHNAGPVYKYTNNGKTYWVTASSGREYRWTGTEYKQYWNVGGTECLDKTVPKELYSWYDAKDIPDVVYSSDDWKIGQCSIVLVNKDIVLK